MKKFLAYGIASVLFFAAMQSSAFAVNFPSFSSLTLNDEPISNDIFAKKRLTMVYMWWVNCRYCEEEMPMLGELARNMPEGSQMVGFLIEPWNSWEGDTDFGLPEARAIVTKAGADFPQILENEELNAFADSITGAPTVMFVDSDGKFVGNTLIGVYVDSNHRIDNTANERRLRKEINEILEGNTQTGTDNTSNYVRQNSENSSGGGCSASLWAMPSALALGIFFARRAKRHT